MRSDIAIIGGGILGTALSYFLAQLNPDKKICVIEQESKVAQHASSRNTGKIHAPYLYNPETKKIFAKATFVGFDMWRVYAECKKLPFKEDGVIEVATDEGGTKMLEKYMRWGKINGLTEENLKFWDRGEVRKHEPEISCENAIFCSRDGSVDYGLFTSELKKDSENAGTIFVLNNKVIRVEERKDIQLSLNGSETIHTKFLINAAGGEAIDIAHRLDTAQNYTDVHFRGEYWKGPAEYNNLTSASVYSVPSFPEYPFLDPHWIIRVDGSCEIGPNAVPVFSPYGYDGIENVKEFVPKMLEMLDSGARKAIFDSQFQSLALNEIASSVSKTAMIKRVQKFLPRIKPERFTEKGFAGIRSSVINSDGKFESDVILEKQERSLSILNYNSPGASGVLPFCAFIIGQLDREGILSFDKKVDVCGFWKFSEIFESMS